MINPDEVYERLYKAGTDWADKDEAWRQLDGASKSILSQIAIKYRPGCKSMTEAETKALADTEYMAFINNVSKAKGDANRARVKYDSANAWWEAMRTQAANLRNEMKL